MYSIYKNPPAQTVSTSPQIKTPPKQIHRNRASYSCHSCRRRKVKCDRQHPVCGGCIKMGVPCEWSDNVKDGSAAADGSPRKASQSSSHGADVDSQHGLREMSVDSNSGMRDMNNTSQYMQMPAFRSPPQR